MEIFKNSTFKKSLVIKDELNNEYIFKIGDIVKLGIKSSFQDKDYILQKEFEIKEECTKLEIELSYEETKNLPKDVYGVFELQLIYNGGKNKYPVVQESIHLRGVVHDE